MRMEVTAPMQENSVVPFMLAARRLATVRRHQIKLEFG